MLKKTLETPLCILIIVFLGALVVRFVCSSTPASITPDSNAFMEAAQALFTQQWWQFRAERIPGYPLFLVLIISLLQAVGMKMLTLATLANTVVLFQSLLGCLTALLACETTQRLLKNPTLSLLAGLACALSPDLILSEHAVLTESLYAFLLALYAFALVSYSGRGVLGAISVLLVWTRHVAIVVAAVTALYFWFSRQKQALCVYSALVLLAIGSWAMFQYQAHGFWGYSAGSGLNQLYKTVGFVDYQSPLEANFKQLLWQRVQLHPPRRLYEAVNDVHVIHAGQQLQRYDQIYLADDRAAARIAQEAILKQPVRYVFVTVRQLAELLLTGTDWDPQMLYWSPLLLLSLLGMALAMRSLQSLNTPLGVIACITAGQFLLYPWMTVCVARYRIPLEPLVIILAAHGLACLMAHYKNAAKLSAQS